ncbi:MAG: hypothetical protein Q4E03_05190 [Trueperella sp.]|nr:hypothetical protein [Trueperella sp.]
METTYLLPGWKIAELAGATVAAAEVEFTGKCHYPAVAERRGVYLTWPMLQPWVTRSQ